MSRVKNYGENLSQRQNGSGRERNFKLPTAEGSYRSLIKLERTLPRRLFSIISFDNTKREKEAKKTCIKYQPEPLFFPSCVALHVALKFERSASALRIFRNV